MNLCVVLSKMLHYFLADPCSLMMMPFMLWKGVWVRLLRLEVREVRGESSTIPLCHVV